LPTLTLQVIDFGLSKKYLYKDDILSGRVGTLYSMSPETMLGDYTSQADLWSIGVCTYALLAAGQKPFEGKTPKQMVAKVLLGKYDFEDPVWNDISEAAKQFIRDLLVVEPKDRMTAGIAKQHPWLVEHERKRRMKSPSDVDESFKEKVRENIVRYAATGDFLKLALNVIAKKSTSEEIVELRSVFDEFDTDNTGTLNLSEFKAALGQFEKYSDEDIEAMFHKIVSLVVTILRRAWAVVPSRRRPLKLTPL
jgi:calcium-dependent protein kinase